MCRTREEGSTLEPTPEDLLALADKQPHELTFGERLNFLWAAVRPRKDEDPEAWRKVAILSRRCQRENANFQGRPQYTNTWVAQQLDERYGVQITPSYLGKLRRADNPNIGLPVLKALAEFFKVDTAFLLPPTTQADHDKIAGIRDNLMTWLNGGNPNGGNDVSVSGDDQGFAIELRLAGVTTADEAQRQVAIALAQWLDDQRSAGKRTPGAGST
jgi:hypothetical protein